MFLFNLDYPQSLHDLNQDYALAPESVQISDDLLSEKRRKSLLTDKDGNFQFVKPPPKLIKETAWKLGKLKNLHNSWDDTEENE